MRNNSAIANNSVISFENMHTPLVSVIIPNYCHEAFEAAYRKRVNKLTDILKLFCWTIVLQMEVLPF